MNDALETLRRLLRTATQSAIDAVVLARTGNRRGEQLTLAGAGLEEEFRELLAQKPYPSTYTE